MCYFKSSSRRAVLLGGIRRDDDYLFCSSLGNFFGCTFPSAFKGTENRRKSRPSPLCLEGRPCFEICRAGNRAVPSSLEEKMKTDICPGVIRMDDAGVDFYQLSIIFGMIYNKLSQFL